MIILDRTGQSPKVLMGKRNPAHVFMPGKYVFPGGRIEPGDRLMATAGAFDARTAAALSAGSPRVSATRARALALAAIRETFEETGLLIGSKGDAAIARTVPGGWAGFVEHGVLPDLGAVTFVGRAITPPGRPRRFDARFFSIDRSAVCHEVGGLIGPEAEFVDLVWIDLADARDLDLPAVTIHMLDELDRRIAAGFGTALPVPFFYTRHGRWNRVEL